MNTEVIGKNRCRGYLPNILLLALMLLYSFLLFPEENIAYTIKIGFATFLFALCLFKISKLVFRLFLILLGLLAAIYYPIINFFGPLSVANIQAFMVTDYREATSYLSIIPGRLYLAAIVLLLLPLLLSFFTFRFFTKRVSWTATALFILLAIGRFFYLNKITYSKTLDGAFNLIPARILGEVIDFYTVSLKGMKYQAQLLGKKDDWVIDSVNADKQIYFVIIGESVRNDVFSNPKLFRPHPLDTIPKINFENVVSYGYTTIPSLTNAFVLRKNNEQNETYFPDNIVTLANKAGIHTEWFSNQGSVGEYDNYISAIARCADYLHFLNSDKQWYQNRKNDTALLGVLKQRLGKSNSKINLYFIHTIGSHPSACDITGGAYDKFVLSDDVSCYIKSISDTKNFIYAIYKIAKNSGKTFKIVYFSDHGQTYDYKDKTLFHNRYSKEDYEIPLFILTDNLSKSINIKAHRNLGDFLNFFQEFTGIKTRNVSYNYRFISEDTEKNWNQLSEGLNFNKLKDNPMPIDLKIAEAKSH